MRARQDSPTNRASSPRIARVRFDARFYLVALFVVIFDVESAFLLAWTVAFRQVNGAGYVEARVFIGVLAAALILPVMARRAGLKYAQNKRDNCRGWTTLRPIVYRVTTFRMNGG